ncbi:MAG: hypothetical protein HQL56_14195 [Magnetococcales bacterium]|nr:hypothetical protein [Magnetococcales bacterium]
MEQSALAQALESAISRAEGWAVNGWKVTFGPGNVEVNSLSAARTTPANFVYRQEAISYWQNIEMAGVETAAQGRKALEALSRNDLHAAGNALYLAVFLEKKINSGTPTWGPVQALLQKQAA